MFGRRSKKEYETQRVDDRRGPDPDGRPDAVAYRRWYGPTRALTTLIAAAGALLLIWFASQVGADDNPAYWAMLGLIAGAGLVMAFSQLLGGWTKFGIPRVSGNVLLLAFVPTLVVTGWVLLAHQPDSELFRNDIRGWSDDVGLLGFVMDFENVLPALAFLTGLTFGFSFDTTGPRTRTAVRRDEDVVERRVDGPVAVPAARSSYDDGAVTTERQVDGPVSVPAAGGKRYDGEDYDGDGYADDRYADQPATAEQREVADDDRYTDDRHAGQPATAERRAVADEDGNGNGNGRGFFGRFRSRNTEYTGTSTARQPEPAPRRTDDLD